MNNFFILLSVFLTYFTINASDKIVDSYFNLEGNVTSSCYESLRNSLLVIPPEIRRYLMEEIHKRKSKYTFKRVSFEEAQNGLYPGTTHGIPVYFASGTTIFHATNHCARYSAMMTHEIGHLIHSSIQINHPKLANQWTKLWSDIFKKHGSPKDPVGFPCPADNCPFIGWKDVDSEDEGFAQLILAGTSHGHWQGNRHPDFLKKMKFLEAIKTR